MAAHRRGRSEHGARRAVATLCSTPFLTSASTSSSLLPSHSVSSVRSPLSVHGICVESRSHERSIVHHPPTLSPVLLTQLAQILRSMVHFGAVGSAMVRNGREETIWIVMWAQESTRKLSSLALSRPPCPRSCQHLCSFQAPPAPGFLVCASANLVRTTVIIQRHVTLGFDTSIPYATEPDDDRSEEHTSERFAEAELNDASVDPADSFDLRNVFNRVLNSVASNTAAWYEEPGFVDDDDLEDEFDDDSDDMASNGVSIIYDESVKPSTYCLSIAEDRTMPPAQPNPGEGWYPWPDKAVRQCLFFWRFKALNSHTALCHGPAIQLSTTQVLPRAEAGCS
jgi:hypothetical protein